MLSSLTLTLIILYLFEQVGLVGSASVYTLLSVLHC